MAGENVPDPIDVEVGQRLRALRLAKNISQMSLAEAAGVTFQQIQKYEQGKNRISASMMCRLAQKLEISPAELFPPQECGRPVEGLAGALKTRTLGELISVLNELDEEQAKLALRLLRALVSKT